MKKVVLIPLMATGILMGCQETQQNQQQAASSVEMQKLSWVGHYQGTTPCMGCLSRCEDCPGMAVKLALHENMTYILERESLSGHNTVEVLQGQLKFSDDAQTQLELVDVQSRNLMVVDVLKKQLEIRQDETAQKHQMQSDFILAKQI